MKDGNTLDRGGTRLGAIASFALLVTVVMCVGSEPAEAVQRVKVTPGFNGVVSTMAGPDADGVVYVGGTFTAFNTVASGYGTLVSDSTASLNLSFPSVTAGTLGIQAVAADGSGGFYIGGDFTSVDGVTRNRAAHINPDGSLDTSWNPNVSGTVYAIAVSGSSVYLGGRFSGSNSVNGNTTRNRVAKVDATTGVVDANWDPNISAQVNAIAVSGSSVYIGGEFNGSNSVGSATRNRAVKVSATDGAVDNDWDPNLGNIVYALAVSGSSVYLGGTFSGSNSVNGTTTRNRAAKVDATTGAVDGNWNPNLGGPVYAIAVSGSSVYLGGAFSGANSVNGTTTRNRAAKVNDTTGVVDPNWDPNLSGVVNAIAVAGSSVYVAGEFNGANSVRGNTLRNRAAKVNDTTGAVDPSWDPNLSAVVNALAVSGSSIYIGGSFFTAGGIVRNNAAAFDSGGALTSWDPNLNNQVNAIAVSGSSVYLGGAFSGANSVNGTTTRNRAAKVDTGTGAVDTSWDPNVSGTVSAIAVSGSNVYMGGAFNGSNSVGSTTRNRVAKVNNTTGAVDSDWNPGVSNGSVSTVVVSGSNVYLGGTFFGANSVGSLTRNRAAKVNSTTGAVDGSWDPNLNGNVNKIAVSDSGIYVVGNFSGSNSVNGNKTLNRAAKVNDMDGTADTGWNPNLNLGVSAIVVSGSSVYLGGSFNGTNSINGNTTRSRAAKVDATTGTVDANWNPNLSSLVAAIAISGSNVYLGGAFSGGNAVNGTTTRNRIAVVDTTSGTLSSRGGSMPAPVLDTSAGRIDRGVVIKSDAVNSARATPGAYKWQRCTSTSEADCSDVVGSGTTGAWWGSRTADIGNRLRVKATWDAIDSTLTSFSALTGVFAPTSTTAPTIDRGLVSGSPKVGTSIRSSFGAWGGYAAGSSTVSFQWQRCTTSDASSCTTNVGTDSQWYRPVAADAGNYLRVTATLTTNGQTATASSTVSGVVASATQSRRSTARSAASKVSRGKSSGRR